jgi:hypothetical protein
MNASFTSDNLRIHNFRQLVGIFAFIIAKLVDPIWSKYPCIQTISEGLPYGMVSVRGSTMFQKDGSAILGYIPE